MTDQSEDELNDLLMAEFESEAYDGEKDASVHQRPLKSPSPEIDQIDDDRKAGNNRITTKQQNYEQILVEKSGSVPQENLKEQENVSQTSKGIAMENVEDDKQSVREKTEIAKQLPESTQVQKINPWHNLEAAKSVKSPQAPGNTLLKNSLMEFPPPAAELGPRTNNISQIHGRPSQEKNMTVQNQNETEMQRIEMIGQDTAIETDPAVKNVKGTRAPVSRVQRRGKSAKVYHYIELLNPESPVYDQDLDTALRDLSKASNCMEGDQLLSGLTKQQHSWYMTNRGMLRTRPTLLLILISKENNTQSRRSINRSGFS